MADTVLLEGLPVQSEAVPAVVVYSHAALHNVVQQLQRKLKLSARSGLKSCGVRNCAKLEKI